MTTKIKPGYYWAKLKPSHPMFIFAKKNEPQPVKITKLYTELGLICIKSEDFEDIKNWEILEPVAPYSGDKDEK